MTEEKQHSEATLSKLQVCRTTDDSACATVLALWMSVHLVRNLQEVMLQKDTQYKSVKENESKLLSLMEMFKKQLKEIEKNGEDKEKKLRYGFPHLRCGDANVENKHSNTGKTSKPRLRSETSWLKHLMRKEINSRKL